VHGDFKIELTKVYLIGMDNYEEPSKRCQTTFFLSQVRFETL